MANKVWIVLGDCGDYYCEGQHPIGVYTTEELADEAAIKAVEVVRRYNYSNGTSKEYKRYTSAIVEQFTLDEMPTDYIDQIQLPPPRRIVPTDLSEDVI